MLTIAEIAKRYGLAESTARYYCKRFRDYLPHVGQGKRRRYLPEALPVFESLLQAMAESKNANLVEAQLEQQFPKHARGAAPSDRSVPLGQGERSFNAARLETLVQRQTEFLEQLCDLMRAALQKQAPAVEIQDTPQGSPGLQKLEKAVAQMQQDISSLRSMQDQAERIHQQDIEQLRKWLNHLAKEQARERENS